MLKKFAGGQQGANKDKSPLLPTDRKHRKEWLEAAHKSECAANLDELLKGLGRSAKEVEKFKTESFDKVYEALGAEVDAGDLVRVLVVRNEKFGRCLSFFLAILTLGLFCCFRPRDDSTVLVLTKQGRVAQFSLDRPSCCPVSLMGRFFVFAKYVCTFFAIFVLPLMIQSAILHISIQEQLHRLHFDQEGIQGFPAYAKTHVLYVGLAGSIAMFIICALMPHDYRDRHRRRHVLREVAASQYVLWGCTCRRRSSMKLFFGTYPNQPTLDLAGTLGNSGCCGPIAPSTLQASRVSAPAVMVGLTIFMSLVSGLDTALAWGERSVVMEKIAEMQLFCKTTGSQRECNMHGCMAWGPDRDLEMSEEFCREVNWDVQDGKCDGCQKGALMAYTAEGTYATFQKFLSLAADIGTLVFTYVAARYALGLIGVSDHIDVLIKRTGSAQMEISKFDNTQPVGSDFMSYVFSEAKGGLAKQHTSGLLTSHTVALDGDDGTKWSGVHNYDADATVKDWEQFFEGELLVPPDSRWTSRVKVPKHCLGIEGDERVLAAWTELPLYPFSMTMHDLITGGLIYQILPFGKTRHAVIVTNRRLFYVRYRRPFLPFRWLGVELRIDCFRHDHDVFYGQMYRTKVNFIHKFLHMTLMRENFLPGVVGFQCKFGTLQLARSHGDVLDVYHLICQLSRNTAEFIDPDLLEANGVNWDQCQSNLQSTLEKKSANLWAIKPQADDAVLPRPDIQLSHAKEQLVYHMSFKDTCNVTSGCYTNTDVVVTTGRIFLWHREVYKKWDCESCLCYFLCWRACLNIFFASKNLKNTCSFFTLPSLLSFSTDLSVDPPSFLVPHHQPLKCPCLETLGFYLTDGRSRESKGFWRFSCLPKRTGPSSHVNMFWRLKHGAHAEDDFVIVHIFKPYSIEDGHGSDEDDVMAGLGYTAEQLEEAHQKNNASGSHEEQVETMRKIMCVVQDECHKLLDEIDVLY